MLRGCARRASTSSTVTRRLLRRGYAHDGADLHELAKRIESGVTKPVGNAATTALQPPGSARSQLAKLSNKGESV